MAVISVNLAILNLLPIPILDGGQIVLAAAEGIKGSPLPARARDIAQTVGLSLILLLMGVAFWNDIARHWSGVVSFLTDAGLRRARAARARDLRGARRGGAASTGDALLGEEDVAEGERHAASLLVCLDRLLARVRTPPRRDRADRARDRAGLVHRPAHRARDRARARVRHRRGSSCPCPRWRRSRCRPRARGWSRRSSMRDAAKCMPGSTTSAARAARASADRCCALPDWLASLPGSDAPLALLGSGVGPHRAELEAALGARARFLPEAAGVLRARTVGRLGLRLAANGMSCAPEAVELRYLRRAEAEAKRLALHPNPEPIPWSPPR